jgi:hypothetical protein
MLGMLPIAGEVFRGPMAYAIIGGLDSFKTSSAGRAEHRLQKPTAEPLLASPSSAEWLAR